MASLSTVAKAEALSQASKMLFGFQPSISYTDTQAIIRFTDAQNKTIANYFNAMMLDPSPPELDIDFVPMAGPWALKAFAPYVIGAIAGSGILGYIIGKR